MKMSKISLTNTTKKNKKNAITCKVISIILTVLPIIVALFLGFASATTVGRVSLTLIGAVSIILALIGFATKRKLGDVIMGIVILALYYTCSKAIPIVFLYVVCRSIDTLIVEPLYLAFKNKYVINKEMDKREQ